MKTIYFLAATALLCSCTAVETAGSAAPPEGSPAIVELSLGVPILESSDGAESAVSDIQIFIFGGDTAVLHHADRQEVESLSCRVMTSCGYRDIRVVANGPDLSHITTLEAWNEAVVSLEENSGGLLMTGALDRVSVGAVWRGGIKLERRLSRLRLLRVTRRMAEPSLEGLPMRIDRVFLTDAVGSVRLDGSLPADPGWRCCTFAGSNVIETSQPWLCHVLPEPVSLPQGGSVDLDLAFYACPNTYAEDDVESPRRFSCTRLVVECRMDINGDGVFAPAETFLYPMPLGALSANTSHDVSELVITRLGNGSDGNDILTPEEDEPLRFPAVLFDVVTRDWVLSLWNGNGMLNV